MKSTVGSLVKKGVGKVGGMGGLGSALGGKSVKSSGLGLGGAGRTLGGPLFLGGKRTAARKPMRSPRKKGGY